MGGGLPDASAPLLVPCALADLRDAGVSVWCLINGNGAGRPQLLAAQCDLQSAGLC